jgi:hypothetical protein
MRHSNEGTGRKNCMKRIAIISVFAMLIASVFSCIIRSAPGHASQDPPGTPIQSEVLSALTTAAGNGAMGLSALARELDDMAAFGIDLNRYTWLGVLDSEPATPVTNNSIYVNWRTGVSSVFKRDGWSVLAMFLSNKDGTTTYILRDVKQLFDEDRNPNGGPGFDYCVKHEVRAWRSHLQLRPPQQ